MKNNKYTLEINKVEFSFIKNSLEYYFINSDKTKICNKCEKKLFDFLNRITKLSDGKTLVEKIKDKNKPLCN